MNKILVIHAFAKAEQETMKRGINNPSITQLATELSDYLDEKENVLLGEKSLRVYRGMALQLENQNEDINIKQLPVIHGLCRYLGYDNYQEFLKNETTGVNSKKPTSIKRPFKRSVPIKLLMGIVIIAVLFLIIYSYSHRQRWMVWQEDHYVEVDFDAKKYATQSLKLYKEDRILTFKKVNVTCDTVFFNSDNSVRFWYGKNKKKEIEYFTDLGLHPETGKTLKPITGYMIDKYVCVD